MNNLSLAIAGTFWCPGYFLVLIVENKGNKKAPATSKRAYSQLEEVVGCKWSVSVLKAVADGVSRPGALERHIHGISTKVLSERLRKLTTYGLLAKHVHAEVPQRTEYSLTLNGRKLVKIIDQIKFLDEEIKDAPDHGVASERG